MTAAHAYELPAEHGQDATLSVTVADVEAAEHGEVVIFTRNGRPVAKVDPIDPDQAWFWTPEWQAGEREVDDAIARGEHRDVHMSGEEFVAHLTALADEFDRAEQSPSA